MLSRNLLFVAACLFLPLTLASQQATASKTLWPSEDFSKQAYVIEHSLLRASFETDGTGIQEWTSEIKVQADAGVKQLAVLNFTYSSASQSVEVAYVRIRKPDGTVVTTPDYNVQDMPAEVTRSAPLYSDVHEKHVAVKALGVGDTLEYQVRYHITKPEVPDQFWMEYNFTRNALVKDEQIELSVPISKTVKAYSPSIKASIKEEGGRRIYRWEHVNLETQSEDEASDSASDLPSISVSTFGSWEEVGKWYAGLQQAAIQPTPEIAAKATALTKGLNSDDEKIRALYDFVSLRIHYVGLDFGIGRYKPHMAQDVLENEYGDCKDKETLFTALMRAAGYDVWTVLVHDSRKLAPEIPSPAQFDHVIGVIPREGKLIWVDTTPEVAPMELLMPTLRDKQVLVIPSQKPPELMTTPAQPPFPQEQKVVVKGKLSADGVFTGHYDDTFRGDAEVSFRSAYRSDSESEWKDLTQRIVNALGFAGEVSNPQVSAPDDTSRPFHLSYDYVRKDYGNWSEKQIVSPLPPSGLELPGVQTKAPKAATKLGAIRRVEYSSTMELPPGDSVEVPADVDLVQSFAEYHSKIRLKAGVLTTEREIVVKSSEVPASDWEALHNFSKAINDDEYRYLTLHGDSHFEARNGDLPAGGSGTVNREEVDAKFRDGVMALQNHDMLRAQELFTEITKEDAHYRGAHFNLALAYAMQGNLTLAVENYRAEEELAPEDERSYTNAAQIEMMLGQRADAMQEWRNLLKADPQNRDAAIRLSNLLLEDSNYDEAATVLQDALKRSSSSPQLELALGAVYVKAGKSEQGVALLKQAIEHDGGLDSADVSTLNNLAYTLAEAKSNLDLAKQYALQAVKTAEAEATSAAAAGDASSPASYEVSYVWDTLGWVYFQSGDIALAAKYVRASWIMNPNEEVGDHLAQIYEKEGKTKEAIHQYDLALSARFNVPSFQPLPHSAEASHALQRYVALTGKKPTDETHRLPNGKWSLSAADELNQMREIKLGATNGVTGSAQFTLVLDPSGVKSAHYVGGDLALKDQAERLVKAHIPMEFPDENPTKIVRTVLVSCHTYEGCNAVLTPLQNLTAPRLQ